VDQNAVALETGSIAVHVPPQATGFHLSSPGLSVVDLGTNFGVRAAVDGTASEVHVFGGKVDAGGIDSAGRSTSPVIHMVEGQAVRHAVASASAPVSIAFAPTGFTRDISELKTAIPMHNTGDRATPGSADPNWLLASIPGDPNWKPRPAMIMASVNDIYLKHAVAGSWIAVNAALDDQPTGMFAFRTRVDLTGFDPASVSITASVAADDCVSDILINGVSTALSTVNKQNMDGYEKTDLAIPAKFWHAGINQIDVVVLNKPQTFAPNCVALHVEWTATGRVVVRR
jgi:hypothetical protein